MKKLFCLLLAAGIFAGCKIEWKTPEKELKSVYMAQLAAMNAEDVEGVMSHFCDDAPLFDEQLGFLHQIKNVYDLRSTLVSFEYIGANKAMTVAYAVIRQRTEKVTGPDFKNNETVTGITFRFQNGSWKIWQSVTLETTFD